MRSGDHFIELTCLLKLSTDQLLVVSIINYRLRSFFQKGFSFLIAFGKSKLLLLVQHY